MSESTATVAATKMASKPKKVVTHPKYSEMVQQAISGLKERGGSSRHAIHKYIMKHFSVGADEKIVNQHLKTALRAGAKSNSLKQAKGSGASGSFRIGEEAKKKAPTKAKKPKTAAKKPAKKPKTPKKTAAAKKPKAKKEKTPKKTGSKTATKAKKPAGDKAKKATTPKAKKAAAKPKKAATTKPKKTPAAKAMKPAAAKPKKTPAPKK